MVKRVSTIAHRDIFEIHSEYCAMFANPARLRLVWTIADGERTVSSLARELGLSVPTASRHLSKLRDKGVVESRREGANLYYRVTSVHFLAGCREIRRGIHEVLSRSRDAFAEEEAG